MSTAETTAARIHGALAMAFLALLPLTPSGKDAAFVALVVVACVRWRSVYAWIAHPARCWLGWCLLGWAGWAALSITWSGHGSIGFEEFKAFRVLLLPLLFGPLLHRPGRLVTAFLLGVLILDASQLVDLVVSWSGGEQVARIGGLLGTHTITVGLLNAVAMCLLVPIILHARGRPVLLAAIALALAAVGLLVAGARGPWIGAAIAVPLVLAGVAWHHSDHRRRALVLAGAGILSAAATWPLAGPNVLHQLDIAVAEYVAWTRGEPLENSSIGKRVQAWKGAWHIAWEHPLQGVGVGAFGSVVDEHVEPYGQTPTSTANSFILHVLASTGLVGAALAVAVILGTIRRGLGATPGMFTDGTLLALLAWLVGGIFETQMASGTMFSIFAFLVALTMSHGTDRKETA